MRLQELLLMYVGIGVACALAIVRRGDGAGPDRGGARGRGRVALSALLAVPLWPLWAPFSLSGPARAVRPAAAERAATPAIEAALAQAVAAVEGSPLAELFPREAADRVGAEVARIEARLAALTQIVGPSGSELEASARSLRELEAHGGPPRVLASARLRHESLARLAALRLECSQALDDLAALLDALRAQLLLARFDGASAVDVEGIVSEVWSRLEGLAATQVGPS